MGWELREISLGEAKGEGEGAGGSGASEEKEPFLFKIRGVDGRATHGYCKYEAQHASTCASSRLSGYDLLDAHLGIRIRGLPVALDATD